MKKGLLLVLVIISLNLSYAQSDNHFDKKDIMLELGVLPALGFKTKTCRDRHFTHIFGIIS